MNRREMLSALGLGAGAVALAGQHVRADDPHHDHAAHKQHLETIGRCALVCNETAAHCLDKIRDNASHPAEHAKIHQMAMDCQEFCVLAVTLMARSSPMATMAHSACADACRACAEVCESSSVKSDQVAACGKSCRECETACREMAKAHAGHHHGT